MVKVAMAGAGAFGNKHLDALASIPGADVVAVVDPVEAAAARRLTPTASSGSRPASTQCWPTTRSMR